MRKPKLGSVQQQYIRAREVSGEVLCLWSPLAPGQRTYCTILEIAPINFLLRAEEEQVALLDRYTALLKALTFPIQILIRNQPLDLRPYLARIQACVMEREATEAQDLLWPELAADLQTLLQRLGSQRALLSRQCYLVIPAPESVGAVRRGVLWNKKQRQARQESERFRALQELTVRVESLEQQLQTVGLLSRRVTGAALARLYQSCLTPMRAQQHPLRDEQFQVVGRLPRVTPTAPLRQRQEAQKAAPFMVGEHLTVDEASVAPVVQGLPARQTNAPSARKRATRSARTARPHPRHSRHPRRARRATASIVTMLPPADVVPLADLVAPGSIQEFRDAVCLDGGTGEEWVSGIVVTAFPREVSTSGWLAPLLLHDDILEVVFHLHPQSSARMLRQLKNRRAGYASTRAFNRRYGRLDEPEMDVATADVARIMSKLASGEERLFEVSLLVLVRGTDRAMLAERRGQVRFPDAWCPDGNDIVSVGHKCPAA